MGRREFIRRAGATAMVATGAGGLGASDGPVRKAVIIGHTGRGNYGHHLDEIFAHRRGIEVVAVADPHASGREEVRARTGAKRAYSDFRRMLEEERPQLVSVAPRWTDQHHPMVSAALAVGAHVYCEKPFTQTLAQADDLLERAVAARCRVAVAHQGRLAPNTLLLKQRIDAGLIGDLQEIRVHGKQDRRAGGEDMVVLGTHQFDLVRYFAGDAQWCFARVMRGGREITLADARHAEREDIGLIAGESIEALFSMVGGVSVHYSSRRGGAQVKGPWGMELIGTKGRARLLNDPYTEALVWRGDEPSARGGKGEWVPLDPGASEDRSVPAANRRVVDDWLAAIAESREPVCSAFAAMKSLEMIHAVFASGLSGARVPIPLRNREHPLGAATPFRPERPSTAAE